MPIRITSTVSGIRRAGMAHSMEPQTYPDDHFTEAEISQLDNEPRLLVEFLKDESPGETGNHEGAVAADRLAELVTCISEMDPENDALWCQDKTPKAAAFPKGTSAQERAAAWDAFIAKIESEA